MSKSKEQKIKKLRRIYIWPSVVFLLISALTAIGMFLGFVTFMLLNDTNERFNSCCSNAFSILNSFELMDGNEEAVIENQRDNLLLTDALFLLDEDGTILFGYGEPTYNSNAWSTLALDISEALLVKPDLSEKYTFCVDTATPRNLVDRSGNFRMDYILYPENYAVFQDTSNLEPNTILFETCFWIRYRLANGKYAAIKCSAPLYYNDFNKALLIGCVAAGALMLPVIFFFLNVLSAIQTQRRTTRLLYTDTITAGNSYIYFEHAGEKILNSRRNLGRLFLIADLTVMKYHSYCNYHGVHAGETLLETIDREITGCLNKHEICVHSEKASFALLLKCDDREQGEARVRAIADKLATKFAESGVVFHAGIYYAEPTRTPDGRKDCDPADCLTRATAARASLGDENVPAICVYNDKLLEEQLWIHKVEEKMQAALDNEEFQVYIQPKYNPVTEQLAGGEALIRWINEEDGFISPGRFIPIFENNGFITRIDDYMLSHVAALQAKWLAEGKSVVPISVNVSRAHFADPELAEHICSLVDAHRVPHHLIEIELTESAFFDDKTALLKIVHRLQELGFEISMDDFGAGYSSLNSLKDLPLDVLKLDADFFRGEDKANRGEIVVSQAIQLAKSLNMRIVAEGVEKKDQVDFLAGQGCDMIQGFYFAKPMPASEYEQKL